MDIFINANHDKTISTFQNAEVVPFIMLPYVQLLGHPFAQFELSKLVADTDFGIKLHNRSLCYYGEVGYSYDQVQHSPQPLPNSDNYIHTIISYVNTVLPNFTFNSVLITMYDNGSDSLGFHSDNEPEIEPDSDIVTISLGESRTAMFKGHKMCKNHPEQSLILEHGDVFIMSRASQDCFQHSIIPDSSKNPRVSITLRHLKPIPLIEPDHNFVVTHEPVDINSESAVIPQAAPSEDMLTLYIGDSMIKHFDSNKMSSASQKAVVLSYPGATVENIYNKVRQDPNFHSIDPNKVSKVYILAGTNDVDRMLHIPFSENSMFIDTNHSFTPPESSFQYFKHQIVVLADFLHDWAKSALISYINILPRESFVRNCVINTLNNHIEQLCIHRPFLTMTSTELHRNLFTFKTGNRKFEYFSNIGSDNVHLNNIGVIRLAKYLKYFAHH